MSAGWIMMVLSLSFVLGLLLFCFYRVMTAPQQTDSPDDEKNGIHLANRSD